MLGKKAGASPFKLLAYGKAAMAIAALDYKVESGESISKNHIKKGYTKVAGVGKSTAVMIQQFMDTGVSDVYSQYEAQAVDV